MTESPLPTMPVIVRFPVHWGEMDAFGHVNNVTYFRYLETSRIAYFDAIGYREAMARDGIGPILAATSCRFRRPLTYPDELIVGARVSEVGDCHFTMKHSIWSTRLGTVAATGEGSLVNYDYNAGEKASLSDTIRAAIADLEASS